jgi:preprotein translocase subunit Sec61beta
MAQEPIRTPSSMAGIMGFYDSTSGGPSLDPGGVLAFTILFIVVITIVSMLM